MSAQPPSITINGRQIARGRRVYVVAELSANHDQIFERAVDSIHAAREAGADAVKIQTYTADTLTIDSDAECFRVGAGTLWAGETLYRLYGRAYTPWAWQPELKRVADGLGIDLFSSPFDRTAVDFLEAMRVPAYKVASFEIVDLPLVEYIAAQGKPMVISTGMATREEIEDALQTARRAGNTQLALLKCCSAYPSRPEDMNLATIEDMAGTFGVPVGLSDHTRGIAVAVAAVTLGACMVEKHFTLSRASGGPDAEFSLEPSEFSAMVNAVRDAEAARGSVHYGPEEGERPSLAFRRSLFVVADVRAGEPFTERNVRSIRPADGLPPKHLGDVLGRRAVRAIPRGTPLSWDLVERSVR